MPETGLTTGVSMTPKREDHLKENEKHAQRSLEQLSRRWPTNPGVYFVLLVTLLLIILFLAF